MYLFNIMSVIIHTNNQPIQFSCEKDLVNFAHLNRERIYINQFKMEKVIDKIDNLHCASDAYYDNGDLFVKKDGIQITKLKMKNLAKLWMNFINAPYSLKYLYLVNPKPFQKEGEYKTIINAKTLTGMTITFSLNQNVQILELKNKIFELVGQPIDQQRIIYRNVQLANEFYLSDYNIKGEVTIHIVCRLRGGMYVGSSFPQDYDRPLQIFDMSGKPVVKIESLAGKGVSYIKTICKNSSTYEKDEIESIDSNHVWQIFFNLMDQWRTSDETQKLFEEAEKNNDTDWIDLIKPKQLQLARELGIEGSDKEIFEKMSVMAHSVANPPICVKYNRAGSSRVSIGEEIPEIKIIKKSDNSETTLQQLAEQSEKKTVVVAAGSFT